MRTVLRFTIKHWKRLLIAAFGTAVASGSVAIARRRIQLPPIADVPTDTGPIVAEPTMGQRIRNIIPKRKRNSSGGGSNGGAGSSIAAPKATPRSRALQQLDEPMKRTPIPERPKSKDIAEDAQRARDAARQTARQQSNDRPDFGLGRRRP